MAFGPNSNNPRERRSYADMMIHRLGRGGVSFEQARRAVDSASGSRKGKESGFEHRLLNAVTNIGHEAAKTVVFIDWTGGDNETQRFGGYAMSPEEASQWAEKHTAAVEREEHASYNEIFGQGYPTVALAATREETPAPNVVWGKAYDLTSDPAHVRLERVE